MLADLGGQFAVSACCLLLTANSLFYKKGIGALYKLMRPFHHFSLLTSNCFSKFPLDENAQSRYTTSILQMHMN